MKKKGLIAFRQTVITAITLVLALLVTELSVRAWFWLSELNSRTDESKIVMPPVIYVKDSDLYEMQSFRLDGLRIGQPHNVVFCISPTIVGSVSSFFLGLIYTENLGMIINIYPVYAVSGTEPGEGVLYEACAIQPEGESDPTVCYFQYESPEEITQNYQYKTTYGNWENLEEPEPGESLNNGIYKSYSNLEFGAVQPESDVLLEKVNDMSRYRFFVMSIEWKADAGEENAKEVDAVYIVTKGAR